MIEYWSLYSFNSTAIFNYLIKRKWKKKLKGHIEFSYKLNFSINFQFGGNETDTKQIDGYGRRVESGLARPEHIRWTEVKSPSASALIRVSDTVYSSVPVYLRWKSNGTNECGRRRLPCFGGFDGIAVFNSLFST